MNRYGEVVVPSLPPGSGGYILTAIDLLARGIEPRPLYSERRRMEVMSPVRLGCHLIIRTAYYRLPNTRLTRLMWRAWRS